MTHPTEKQHIHLLHGENKGGETAHQHPIEQLVKTDEEKEVLNAKHDQVADFAEKAARVINKKKDDKLFVQTNQLMMNIKDIIVPALQSSNYREGLLELIRIIRYLFDQLDYERLYQTFPENLKKEDREFALQSYAKFPEARAAFHQSLSLFHNLCKSLYGTNNMDDADVVSFMDLAKGVLEIHSGVKLDLTLLRLKAITTKLSQDTDLLDFINHCILEVSTLIQSNGATSQAPPTDPLHEFRSLLVKGSAFARIYQSDPDIKPALYEIQSILESLIRQIKLQESPITQKSSFDPLMISSLKDHVIPFLTKRLKEIPVKGFKISNPDFIYLLVDDIFVSVENIMPDHVKLVTESYADVNLKDSQNPMQAKSVLNIVINGLRLNIKDFYFSFKRKTPIGNVSDEGRGSIKMTGEGLRITIKQEFDVDSKRPIPTEHESVVTACVDKFDLNFTEANHKFLLNLASGLFKDNVQKEIENAVQLNIKQYVQELADLLNDEILAKKTHRHQTNVVTTAPVEAKKP